MTNIALAIVCAVMVWDSNQPETAAGQQTAIRIVAMIFAVFLLIRSVIEMF